MEKRAQYVQGKCDYCGKEGFVLIVQHNVTVKTREQEYKMVDIINGVRKDNPVQMFPYLCKEHFEIIEEATRPKK
ncbi:MAG: hypothetical protein PHY39_07955 [Endomicrobiaceae bacterium]|nr:hypothetical protein [Endomicrobiaceae bacterium]